nr:flagellin [Paracraurococcus ruber]
MTNNGAMVALQSLQMTQKNLLDTQNRISTGLKVASAKDNAATWAVATAMRSDIANFKQVSENLSTSASIVGTARAGAEQITSLITQIKAKVTSAQDPSKDKTQIQNDIDQLVAQIQSTVDSSAYNGVNLVNNGGAQRFVASVNNVSGVSTPSYIAVSGQDLNVNGGGLSALKNLDVTARGDTLFGTSNAGQKAMGTKQATFANFDAATGLTATAYGSGTFTVNYTDAAGSAKTVTVSSATAMTATTLNSDANFAKLFQATAGGTGEIILQAATRDVETGSFSINSVEGSAVLAPAVANGAAGSPIAAANAKTSADFTFQAVPLKAGETFQLDYSINGTNKTVKLQVADKASGTLLSTDGNGVNTYAVDASVVSVFNASATNIGAEIRAALLGSNDFAAAAADGTKLGVTATTGRVVIASVDGTDAVRKFSPPATDYKAMLANVDTAAKAATNAAAVFGSAGTRIDTQKTFMDKLADTLTTGVGALVDADMSEEAARLTALQTQQQLGTQALSIANQAPQMILSLFRS